MDGLNHFFETSPARRVDEIQGILTDQIKKSNKDLLVVVEDIDRSGDSGVFFLETLKQFISNLKTNNKIVVIVPMSDVSYGYSFFNFLLDRTYKIKGNLNKWKLFYEQLNDDQKYRYLNIKDSLNKQGIFFEKDEEEIDINSILF